VQEAQPPHEVEAELRRQRVALIKSGQDLPTGLADASVIHSHHQNGVVAPAGATLEDGLEQILGFPAGAAVKLVVGAPVPILAAQCPKGAGKSAASQRQERAEGLFDSAFTGACLGKGGSPCAEDFEQSVEEYGLHVSSLHVKHNSGKKKPQGSGRNKT
jgi:hypothetical protein